MLDNRDYATGLVNVPPTHLANVSLVDVPSRMLRDGLQAIARKQAGKDLYIYENTAVLPRYRFVSWVEALESADGVLDRLAAMSADELRDSAVLERADAPAQVTERTLALGAPYKLKVGTSTEEGSGVIVGTSIRVFGRAGEEYALLFDDPLQPEVEVRGKGNRKIVKGDKMAKAGVEEWQANETKKDNALWFPKNYVFELPAGFSERLHKRIDEELDAGAPPPDHATG